MNSRIPGGANREERRLEERIRYLEEVIRHTREALELACDLGNFQASVNTFDTPEVILTKTEERVRQVITFNSTAWFLVREEDATFGFSRCEPAAAETDMRNELDRLTDNKTIAWTLDSSRPSITTTADGRGALLIHTLATASRIRGLFMGRLAGDSTEIPDGFLTLLTIIFQGCANTIESYELYRLNRRTTLQLEEKLGDLLQAKSQLRAKSQEQEDTVKRLKLENDLHLKTQKELKKANQEITEGAKALAVSEERYRTLFETMVQGVVLLDSDGVILSVNPAAEHILGISIKDIGSMTCADPIWENVCEDGRPCPPEALPSAIALRTRKSVHGVVIGKLNLKEGKRRWLTVNAVPLFPGKQDAAGQVFTTLSDITTLRRSEQTLKRLVDTMPVLIHAHDVEGKYVFWNKESERVLGYTAEEVYSDPNIRDKIFPDFYYYQNVIEKYHKGVRDFEEWEAVMKTSDGATRIIAWTSRSTQAPIQGWARWETGVDVTARKRAEKALERLTRDQEKLIRERTMQLTHKTDELVAANRKLRQLDELKSAFLSTVSHDIRTPLTSIMGFAKLSMRNFERHYLPLAQNDKNLVSHGKQLRDNLAIIVSEGERLKRLINDFLDLSRIESGHQQWHDKDIRPASVLETAVRAVSGDYEAKPKVTLEVNISPRLPMLNVDPDRIIQVLINLLHNAIKFTDRGRVTTGVEANGDLVRYYVRDTGMGIPPEELDNVFDKFHQLASGDLVTEKAGGSGLGLSICKEIVLHYQGRIWTESSFGKGSAFFVELPGHW